MFFVRNGTAGGTRRSATSSNAQERRDEGRRGGAEGSSNSASTEQETSSAMDGTAGFRLVDAAGAPLAGLSGTVHLSDGTQRRFKTGSDGRYFVGSLPPGTTFDVELDELPDGDAEEA